MKKSIFYTLLSVLFILNNLQAQQIEDNSGINIRLSDGTDIVIYQSMVSGQKSNMYYYLPVNLQVSENKDKTPEMSLLIYGEGDIQGGILHFLLKWGLNKSQEDELSVKLKNKIKDSSAILAGPLMVDAQKEGFEITSDEKLAQILRNSLSQKSEVPLMPGAKFAASFKLSAVDAGIMNDLQSNPDKIKAGSIKFCYTYNTLKTTGFVKSPVENEWFLELSLKEIFQCLKK